MASAGTGLLRLNTAFACGAEPMVPDPVFPVSGVATTEVMGGSALPNPLTEPTYIPNVNELFINPNLPETTPAAPFTPEGLYPLTGVNSLPSTRQSPRASGSSTTPSPRNSPPENQLAFSATLSAPSSPRWK